VRAVLEAWRPYVDEVVLAVDERGDGSVFAACEHVVDQIHIAPAVRNMERYLGWLHSLCSEDWILRVDDDELPSAALVAALHTLLEERELTHFWLPRRWPYPTGATYIAGGPWGRDIQVRLVRNLPGLWRFSGANHSNIEVTGPSRVLSEPLLHVVTVLRARGEREAKYHYYERLTAGLTNTFGNPLNVVYLPEDAPEVELASMDHHDAESVAVFLAKAGADKTPPTPVTDQASRPTGAEVERWLGERELSPGAYAATVTLLDEVTDCQPNFVQHVRVEVSNQGDEWLPRGPVPAPPVFLGHRWYRLDGSEVRSQIARTPLTETVAPGAMTRLTAAVQAPDVTGTFELHLDLVHEFVRWFEQPARQRIVVTASSEACDQVRADHPQPSPP